MISVCMATYNGQKYIKEQVDSILAQLTVEDELVVSDDGSTDATIKILQSYNDPRIKIFDNNVRKGVIGNFENGLRNTKGDYIFLSDQDDIWLPGKVNKCIDVLQRSDLVLHDTKIWNGNEIINDSFFALRGSKAGYWNNLKKNSYIGCCMAFNRNLLNTVLPLPSDIAMHDMYIGLIGERNFKVEFLPEALLFYRRHVTNSSTTGEKSGFSRIYQFSYRLKMFHATFCKK